MRGFQIYFSLGGIQRLAHERSNYRHHRAQGHWACVVSARIKAGYDHCTRRTRKVTVWLPLPACGGQRISDKGARYERRTASGSTYRHGNHPSDVVVSALVRSLFAKLRTSDAVCWISLHLSASGIIVN